MQPRVVVQTHFCADLDLALVCLLPLLPCRCLSLYSSRLPPTPVAGSGICPYLVLVCLLPLLEGLVSALFLFSSRLPPTPVAGSGICPYLVLVCLLPLLQGLVSVLINHVAAPGMSLANIPRLIEI